MMNENYNTPNSGCCGRPFPTAPENKCKYNDCCMNEYAYKQKACIRNKQPDCESQAVIPSITVETVDGITNLANCLVHVTSTNTTYYIDDKHRIMITWAGPVNIPGYDMEHNPNHYKNQIVTDTESKTAVIYDNHGIGYVFGIEFGDIQEAVNEKINEMVEQGVFQQMLDDLFGDKINDLEAFANEFNPSGVTVTQRTLSASGYKTDYFITYIPHKRNDGKINHLKQKLFGLSGQNLTAAADRTSAYARRHGCAVCINSATYITTGANKYLPEGKYIIQDGVQVIYPTGYTGTNNSILAIKEDDTLAAYDASVNSASDLINDGVKYCLTAFFPLIESGVVTPTAQSSVEWNRRYQRQIIGQDADKNIYILTSNGKPENGGNYSYGLTLEECSTILLNLGCTFAYFLDGGGSTTTVVNSTIINQVTDEANREERTIPFILYVEDDKPEYINELNKNDGMMKDEIRKYMWDARCLDKTNDVRADAISQPAMTYRMYNMTGSAYTGTDLPSDEYKYGYAEVLRRDQNVATVICHPTTNNFPPIISKTADGGTTWSGWNILCEQDTTTLSLSSTVGTLSNIKTIKIGDVAYLSCILTTTSAITANTVIISGVENSYTSSAPFLVWDNNNTETVTVNIAGSGHELTARSNIQANASLRLNISYIIR